MNDWFQKQVSGASMRYKTLIILHFLVVIFPCEIVLGNRSKIGPSNRPNDLERKPEKLTRFGTESTGQLKKELELSDIERSLKDAELIN